LKIRCCFTVLCFCSFVNEIARRTRDYLSLNHPTCQLEVLRCNYDLSNFLFITNCQVVLYVVQVWLFENGPSRSGVNRWSAQKEEGVWRSGLSGRGVDSSSELLQREGSGSGCYGNREVRDDAAIMTSVRVIVCITIVIQAIFTLALNWMRMSVDSDLN
jgi:hypothetical protein